MRPRRVIGTTYLFFLVQLSGPSLPYLIQGGDGNSFGDSDEFSILQVSTRLRPARDRSLGDFRPAVSGIALADEALRRVDDVVVDVRRTKARRAEELRNAYMDATAEVHGSDRLPGDSLELLSAEVSAQPSTLLSTLIEDEMHDQLLHHEMAQLDKDINMDRSVVFSQPDFRDLQMPKLGVTSAINNAAQSLKPLSQAVHSIFSPPPKVTPSILALAAPGSAPLTPGPLQVVSAPQTTPTPSGCGDDQLFALFGPVSVVIIGLILMVVCFCCYAGFWFSTHLLEERNKRKAREGSSVDDDAFIASRRPFYESDDQG